MTRWAEDDPSLKGADYQTYHEEIPLHLVQSTMSRLPNAQRPYFGGITNGNVRYEDILAIAFSHYNWLAEQLDFETLSQTSTRLVATIWDPDSRTFYSSTIPQASKTAGPRFGRKMTMIRQGNTNAAKAWYDAMPAIMALQKAAPFHAEDGAFYNWLTTVEPLSGQAPSGQTLRRPTIAVYGTFNHLRDAARERKPCSEERRAGGDDIDPKCQKVAEILGVDTVITLGRTVNPKRFTNLIEAARPDRAGQSGTGQSSKRPRPPSPAGNLPQPKKANTGDNQGGSDGAGV